MTVRSPYRRQQSVGVECWRSGDATPFVVAVIVVPPFVPTTNVPLAPVRPAHRKRDDHAAEQFPPASFTVACRCVGKPALIVAF